MIVSEKSFVGFGDTKKPVKKVTNVVKLSPTRKEIQDGIQLARDLHNMRARSILQKFSDLPVFQEGGSLVSLVTMR